MQDFTHLVSESVRHSIAEVVAYDWATEERDYCEQLPEDRENHVFEHLERIDAWLKETATTSLAR